MLSHSRASGHIVDVGEQHRVIIGVVSFGIRSEDRIYIPLGFGMLTEANGCINALCLQEVRQICLYVPLQSLALVGESDVVKLQIRIFSLV